MTLIDICYCCIVKAKMSHFKNCLKSRYSLKSGSETRDQDPGARDFGTLGLETLGPLDPGPETLAL